MWQWLHRLQVAIQPGSSWTGRFPHSEQDFQEQWISVFGFLLPIQNLLPVSHHSATSGQGKTGRTVHRAPWSLCPILLTQGDPPSWSVPTAYPVLPAPNRKVACCYEWGSLVPGQRDETETQVWSKDWPL